MAKQEIERDELAEAFDSRRIITEQHPDLGFRSSAELNAAITGLEKLLRHPDSSGRVIGKYKLLLEQQRDFALAKDVRDYSRRNFLGKGFKMAAWVGGIGLVGGSIVKGVTAFRDIRRNDALNYEEALEHTNTLSFAPTTPSAWGWTAYYPRRDSNISYVDSGFGFGIKNGGQVEAAKSSVLNTTGFSVWKHERRDGITPKFHITTQLSSSSTPTEAAAEEWVLKAIEDNSNPEIDPRVVVLEKRDPILTQPIRVYLQITYAGTDQFAAKIMERQVKP